MKHCLYFFLLLLSAHTTIKTLIMPKMPVPTTVVTPKAATPMPVAPTLVAPVPVAAPKVVIPTPSGATAATTTKGYSVDIAIAYKINIFNTGTTPATVDGITIQYTTSDAPTKVQTLTTKTQLTIPANKGISFLPKINIKSSQQNISAQFQGITKITVNSQPIVFSQAKMGASAIYIANQAGKWQLTTKPTKSKTVAAQKAKAAPAPKITTTQAATVPVIKKTDPKSIETVAKSITPTISKT